MNCVAQISEPHLLYAVLVGGTLFVLMMGLLGNYVGRCADLRP